MTNQRALTTNRKAQRILRDAFLHMEPYNADVAAEISRAMDRVANERAQLLRERATGRRRRPLPIWI